jgi:hypothetical protein
VKRTGDLIKVRDGKLGDASPELAFDGSEWDSFRQAMVAGEF